MEDLERLIKETPAPSSFMRLAHLHLQQGNAVKAAEVAHKGIELFGETEDLSQILTEANHASQMAEVDQIRSKIERFPNPTLYARLATIYLEQNDIESCTRTCAIAVKAFPDYAGIYLVLAHASRKQGHADKVLHYLEKAAELDAFNYAAHMMLAEELINRGKTAEARASLEVIRRFAPEDERVKTMLAQFDAAQTQKTAGKPEEDTRKLPSAKRSSGIIMDGILSNLSALEGLEACLLVDQAGLIVVSRTLSDAFDEELAAAVVSNVCHAVHESSADLGIGDFLEVNVEGDFGTLQLMPVKDMVLAAFAGPSVRAGCLQRAMHGCIQELATS